MAGFVVTWLKGVPCAFTKYALTFARELSNSRVVGVQSGEVAGSPSEQIQSSVLYVGAGWVVGGVWPQFCPGGQPGLYLTKNVLMPVRLSFMKKSSGHPWPDSFPSIP